MKPLQRCRGFLLYLIFVYQKMLGKAVYCHCKNNPNCKYCFDRGTFYVPYNTNNSFTHENTGIKNKPNSYDERFLTSDERILPEYFKVWISDKKIESRPFELLSVRDSDENISLRTKFATVDFAIKTAHIEIENRIEIWYAYDK